MGAQRVGSSFGAEHSGVGRVQKKCVAVADSLELVNENVAPDLRRLVVGTGLEMG